jgi:hypothetical protein
MIDSVPNRPILLHHFSRLKENSIQSTEAPIVRSENNEGKGQCSEIERQIM